MNRPKAETASNAALTAVVLFLWVGFVVSYWQRLFPHDPDCADRGRVAAGRLSGEIGPKSKPTKSRLELTDGRTVAFKAYTEEDLNADKGHILGAFEGVVHNLVDPDDFFDTYYRDLGSTSRKPWTFESDDCVIVEISAFTGRPGHRGVADLKTMFIGRRGIVDKIQDKVLD